MARQQYMKVTTMGPTEIQDHTVNWSDITIPLEDRIVNAEFDFDNEVMQIQWENFTDFDTTLCINSNGIAPGNYYAGHTVYLESGRKLRRTVRVRVVQR